MAAESNHQTLSVCKLVIQRSIGLSDAKPLPENGVSIRICQIPYFNMIYVRKVNVIVAPFYQKMVWSGKVLIEITYYIHITVYC